MCRDFVNRPTGGFADRPARPSDRPRYWVDRNSMNCFRCSDERLIDVGNLEKCLNACEHIDSLNERMLDRVFNDMVHDAY